MKELFTGLPQGLSKAWWAEIITQKPCCIISLLPPSLEEQSAATRESIIRWLLGKDLERFEMLNSMQLEIAKQAMEYRWRILRYRYLGVEPEQAYRNLMQRLGSIVLLQSKNRTWVAKSCVRASAFVDVLQKVIQELLQSDRYMQQQMAWIAECTDDAQLRNALLFASTEEYCLRPIRNQPLLVYQFANYLRRTSCFPLGVDFSIGHYYPIQF